LSISTAQSVKGYELLELIGEGAYGVVYRTQQMFVERIVEIC
jgi:hypothetical protein